MTVSSKRPSPIRRNNLLESLRDIAGGVSQTVANDVIGRIGNDAINSVVGGVQDHGEIRPNQPLNIPEKSPLPRYRPPESFTRPQLRLEEKELGMKIQAVRTELAALAASMKSLDQELQHAVMEQPVTPGIYHLNYYDRLKNVIRAIRLNIEESRTWLSLSTSRKNKKSYWGKYKKHGTTFGLSHERTLATSSG
jgi:hypothetical protein